MKWIVALLALCILIGGCNGGQRVNKDAEYGLSDKPAENQPGVIPSNSQPERMPGGIGVSSGQSGTGTTSGASTGY